MNSRRNFLKFLGIAPAVPAAAALAAQFPDDPLPVVAAATKPIAQPQFYHDGYCTTWCSVGATSSPRLFTDAGYDPHADEDVY